MEVNILLGILFWINVITFFIYVMDKRYAYYSFWRIPEAVLIVLALLGGAYGAGMAMLLFRHKTRHRIFTILIPIFLVIWMTIIVYMYIN